VKLVIFPSHADGPPIKERTPPQAYGHNYLEIE